MRREGTGMEHFPKQTQPSGHHMKRDITTIKEHRMKTIPRCQGGKVRITVRSQNSKSMRKIS